MSLLPRHRPPIQAVPCTLILLLLCAACANQKPQAPVQKASDLRLPETGAKQPVDLPGLHNVVAYADDVFSGAVPEGEQGFATLAALGIQTIVSVDGARPEVELAQKHGLRYVHLPISYDGITPERQREMAQAIANLPGPVYLHCHHGKHRSATAAAAACIGTGRITPEQAMARMQVSGTAPGYKGLWQVARAATPMTETELRRDPSTFEAIARVSGMVEAMSSIDQVFENLKAVEQAAWQVPADHPDLVPAKETRRLLDLFVQMEQDPESRTYPVEYQQILGSSIAAARALDDAVRAGNGTAASAQYAALGKSCKECHRTYRDQ